MIWDIIMLVLTAGCMMTARHFMLVSLRVSVTQYLFAHAGSWVETGDLNRIFGVTSHTVMRKLEDEGFVDRQESNVSGVAIARGGRPLVSYRWRKF